MNPFDDDFNDPFESIIREFFGDRVRYRNQNNDIIKGEEEDRVIDFIETKDSVFIVFELLGYDESDIEINVDNSNIEINAMKKDIATCQNYLCNKLKNGVRFTKKLPKFISSRKYKSTFKNGVLEIEFMKR